MEKQQQKRTHTFLFGLVIFFFGGCLSGFSLEAKLSLDNDRFVVGQKFSVDILVDAPEPLKVKLIQPSYPPALEMSTGPFTRDTTWETTPGRTIKGTRITLGFHVVSTGIVSLGPFTLTYNGQTILVASRPLYLLARDEAQNRFPLEVRWNVPSGPYYQGEDIPIMLQVRNLESLLQPKDIDVPAPANTLWEKAVGLGEIEVTAIGDDRILDLPWGGWMMIPSQAGTVTLPSVNVDVNGLMRKTVPLDLSVLPLPSAVAGTRAIGDFTYEIRLDQESSVEGQVNIVQEVRGRGNFPYLVFPDVQPSGMRLVSKQETSGYRPTTVGYQGVLTQTWIFAADKAGTYTVTLPGFTSYQPELDKVWTWDPKTVQVATNVSGALTVPEPRVFIPLDEKGIERAKPWNLLNNPFFWSAFLPGPIFFLIGFFSKGGKGKRLLMLLPLTGGLLMAAPFPIQMQQGLQAWKDGQISVALGFWRGLAQAHPDEPGLWYNLGLAEEKSGQPALAVRFLSRALATGFQGGEALSALRDLEKKEQLVDQFPIWSGPSTDLILALAALAWNGSFLFWGFHRWSGKAVWIIPLSLAFLIFAASAVVATIALSENRRVDAVVGTIDAPIRRVPGDLAEEWLTVKRGTVVQYQGFSGPYALVLTGYGLEGWVKVSYLLPVQDR